MNIDGQSGQNRREVVIVDYGMGNLGSVANMVKYVGGTAHISNDVNIVANAAFLILPGVGNFAYGMDCLQDLGLIESLNAARNSGSHVLGICLGMQLMTQWCEEGMRDGLGWFDLKTLRFPRELSTGERISVPHMGWNQVDAKSDASQFKSVPVPSRFYFVHSYFVDGADADECQATTVYGDTRFASAIGKGNVIGVQFHPEKSHKFGIAFLRDFIRR